MELLCHMSIEMNDPEPTEQLNDEIRRIDFEYSYCKISAAWIFMVIILKQFAECKEIEWQ